MELELYAQLQRIHPQPNKGIRPEGFQSDVLCLKGRSRAHAERQVGPGHLRILGLTGFDRRGKYKT